MMISRSGAASPVGRKVLVAARLLGVFDRLSNEPTDKTDPEDSLRQRNRLGKNPALVLEGGCKQFDSCVFAEFLGNLAGGGTLFPRNAGRWGVLTEAALPLRHERTTRTEAMRSVAWVDCQQGKIDRAHRALDCLDMRLGERWRAAHPKLVGWLDACAAAAPAFAEARAAR